MRCARRAPPAWAPSPRRARALSGNRRKLCLAMALFGLRREGLALLDEPTAGVDPSAREIISSAIRDAAKRRQCACVVTSHAVEDVAALCDRVGVMVDGAMRCLGAPQHLRERPRQAPHAHRARRKASRHTRQTRQSRRRQPGRVRARGCARRVGSRRRGGRVRLSSASVARATRAFGFIEGASKEDDDALAEARRIAATGAAEAAAGVSVASRTWELPASADLPSVLEALEKRQYEKKSAIEGYAVGQASLEDVFLEFASRGSGRATRR